MLWVGREVWGSAQFWALHKLSTSQHLFLPGEEPHLTGKEGLLSPF